MSNFKVGCSPIIGVLYAGTVNKKGAWGKKHDVTDTAVGAVAEHLIQRNEELRFNLKGKSYALRVVEIKEKPNE